MADGITVHAFLWENGGPMVDLNTLIPSGAGFQVTEGVDINDRGEITGNGLPSGCNDLGSCGHAYLLIPCDEKHPGECDDYSMIEVATSQTRSQKSELPAVKKQGSESPVSPAQELRNMMRQRYHIPGQPTAPRD
jgi:hypothetical protein